MATLYTPESPDNKAIRELRDEVKKLRSAIEDFNKEASVQTRKVIRLTRWITILTIVMVLGIFYQIYIALPKERCGPEVFEGNKILCEWRIPLIHTFRYLREP